MTLTDRLFCAWRWICNRLPMYSWNRACAEWENGRLEGINMERASNGCYRGPKGRYVSLSSPNDQVQRRSL